MFYLRRTLTDWAESNVLLGNEYEVVRYDESPELFCSIFEKFYNLEYMPDDVYDESYEKHLCMAWYHSCLTEAFVTTEDLCIPICPILPTYVMTESGKTFSRVNSMNTSRATQDQTTGEVAPIEWVEHAEKVREEQMQKAIDSIKG